MPLFPDSAMGTYFHLGYHASSKTWVISKSAILPSLDFLLNKSRVCSLKVLIKRTPKERVSKTHIQRDTEQNVLPSYPMSFRGIQNISIMQYKYSGDKRNIIVNQPIPILTSHYFKNLISSLSKKDSMVRLVATDSMLSMPCNILADESCPQCNGFGLEILRVHVLSAWTTNPNPSSGIHPSHPVLLYFVFVGLKNLRI